LNLEVITEIVSNVKDVSAKIIKINAIWLEEIEKTSRE
jgi:hypothetical protein